MTGTRGGWRVVPAAVLGNVLEWYDFTIYVALAPYIGRLFFPGGDPSLDLIKALVVFGVGFAARPLGALLIGRYGDRAGRKPALVATIGLMALGSALLAAAPTYSMAGILAPITLLIGRLLQGLSAGGEFGGALTYLVEQAPEGRKGVYGAALQTSMALSNLVGAAVVWLTTASLGPERMAAWGWRAPFCFGLLIVPVGLWLRRALTETPAFIAERRERPAARPLRELVGLLRRDPASLALAVGLSSLWAVSIYVLIIYMPVHCQTVLRVSPKDAFAASAIANIILGFTALASGLAVDRWDAQRLMAIFVGLLLIGPPLLFFGLAPHPSLGLLITVEGASAALVGLFSGAMPAALARLFPTQARSSGVSLAYNLAATLFAGFAPAILGWLSSAAWASLAPALYVSLIAFMAASLGAWRRLSAPSPSGHFA